MPDQPANPQPDNNAPKKFGGKAQAISMSTCMAIGLLFGTLYNNLTMGIGIGVVVGAIIGIITDAKKAK